MGASPRDYNQPEETDRSAHERTTSWSRDANTTPESDVQSREPYSPRGGDGAGYSNYERAVGNTSRSQTELSSRPPSASAQYQQQQRTAAGSSRTRRSFAFSDTPTAVTSTSPTLSGVVPAGSSTLSGPTLASVETEAVYALPAGQTRTSRDGTLMYHLTLEEIREAERAQNRRLAQLPPRLFTPTFNQIRESERDEGPVLGTEQEPMLNEDYAEAIATIEGVSRRTANRRANTTRSNSSSGEYREEWGRGGRGSLMDQRWSSPPDRERH